MMHASGGGKVFLWRLERARHVETWEAGIGAEKAGGRWNSRGRRAVYGSLDPATAILEVAAHKGFTTLDTVPHILLCAEILDPDCVHQLAIDCLPNNNWLIPGTPGQGQQQYGDGLLDEHPFFTVPSTVSRHSWNIVLNPDSARGKYRLCLQERFSLDTRLNPPPDPW
ncbi:RES family NAD+ phosphorylase [Kushneria aurantia]|uniref:RES family NAD+ phosphorylase n=1 Tax=Kushneria aurantia TaxID=504092 RepID=A0ABV6G789_9GAMM|nr:RES domain-containing protein [Kushneria aurantia]